MKYVGIALGIDYEGASGRFDRMRTDILSITVGVDRLTVDRSSEVYSLCPYNRFVFTGSKT